MFSHFFVESQNYTTMASEGMAGGSANPEKKRWKHLQVPCFPNRCERHVVVVVDDVDDVFL